MGRGRDKRLLLLMLMTVNNKQGQRFQRKSLSHKFVPSLKTRQPAGTVNNTRLAMATSITRARVRVTFFTYNSAGLRLLHLPTVQS